MSSNSYGTSTGIERLVGSLKLKVFQVATNATELHAIDMIMGQFHPSRGCGSNSLPGHLLLVLSFEKLRGGHGFYLSESPLPRIFSAANPASAVAVSIQARIDIVVKMAVLATALIGIIVLMS